MSTTPVPGIDTNDSDEEAFQRDLVIRLARGLVMSTATVAGVAVVLGMYDRLVAPAVIAVLQPIAIRLARQERVAAASWFTVGLWFTATTAAMFRFGGVTDPATNVQIIAVVLAGLLLGRRGALAAGGAVLFTIAVALALETAEALPAVEPLDDEIAVVARLLVLLVTVAALVLHAQQRTRSAATAEHVRHEREALLESVPMIVTIIDLPTNRTEYVNPEHVRLLGLDTDGLNDLSPEERAGLVHPDDRRTLARTAAEFRRTGGTDGTEVTYRLRTVDGWRWFTFHSRVLTRDAAAAPERVIATGIDVHEQIETREEYGALLAAAPMSISVLHTPNGVRDDRASYARVGVAGPPLPVPDVDAQIHPDDLNSVRDRWAAFGATGGIDGQEATFRLQGDDGWQWYTTRARVLTRGADGAIERVLVVGLDITGEREAEVLADTILDANPNIVLVWDPETMVAEFANPAFTRVTGYTAADLNDLDRDDIPSLVHPDDVAGEEAAIEQAVASGEPVPLLHRIRRHDGTWLWFETWYRSFPDIHGTRPRRVLVNSTDVSQRVELESLYNTVIDESPVMFVVYDAAVRRYEWVNPAFTEATGFEVDELNRRAAAHPDKAIITHPDDLAGELEATERALATGERTEVRHRVISADGTIRTFDSRIIRLDDESDPGGPGRRFLMGSLDVTERVETEQFNETILDNSPSMMRVFNADPDETHTLFVNKMFTEYSGMTLEDLQAMTTAERRALTPDEDRPAVNEALARARNGEMAIVRRRHLDRHGELRWLDTRYVPLPDATGTWPHRMLVTSVDITDQLSAEQMNETILRSSPSLTSVFDVGTGQTTFASTSFTESTGYTADELNAMPRAEMEALTPGPARAEVNHAIAAAQETGEIQHVAHPYRHADGSLRWYDTHMVALPGDTGELLVSSSDTTDRHEAEEALEAERERLLRANRDLEGFVYIASHDLQEPLRTITAFAALLEADLPDDLGEDISTYLSYIAGGTARMRALISDLLELSRIGQDHAVSEVNTTEMLRELEADLHDQIDREGATLHFDGLPTITADPTSLRIVLRNLLTNALKFRDDDRSPVVDVSATRGADGWRFEVTDNGIGIADHHVDRIFKVFQRLNPRSAYEGTGIGLANCLKAVEHHGGTIGVESDVGVGSTFWFTIPDGGDVA